MERERDEGREVMMKHIVAKRTLSCCAALWCCVCEMGSSCGLTLLFWDMKSSLLFYRAKLDRKMREENRKAKILTLDDVKQVLSIHISLFHPLQLGKHIIADLQRITHCTLRPYSQPKNVPFCLFTYMLLFQIDSPTTFKLLISIYTICKLLKNSNQHNSFI